MSVYRIDPIDDKRWHAFIEKHPQASIFHTPGWIKALRETYGYEPVVYTTNSPTEPITNGIPFCKVLSWITGSRLVSLPFSDHCQPLFDEADQLSEILSAVAEEVDSGDWKYVELRPWGVAAHLVCELGTPSFGVSESYLWFTLDLSSDIDAIYASFHRSSVRERITRSQREGLEYREGTSDELIRDFFRLLVSTRKKHQVPPQPFDWFRNLRDCLGASFTARATYTNDVPTAITVDLGFRTAHCSKYSASDYRFAKLGGTQLLRWKAISKAKSDGAAVFDMCRCEPSNKGLAAYKGEWGTTSSCIDYYRYPAPSGKKSGDRNMEIAGRVFSKLPDSLLILAGRFLYKHIG